MVSSQSSIVNELPKFKCSTAEAAQQDERNIDEIYSFIQAHALVAGDVVVDPAALLARYMLTPEEIGDLQLIADKEEQKIRQALCTMQSDMLTESETMIPQIDLTNGLSPPASACVSMYYIDKKACCGMSVGRRWREPRQEIGTKHKCGIVEATQQDERNVDEIYACIDLTTCYEQHSIQSQASVVDISFDNPAILSSVLSQEEVRDLQFIADKEEHEMCQTLHTMQCDMQLFVDLLYLHQAQYTMQNEMSRILTDHTAYHLAGTASGRAAGLCKEVADAQNQVAVDRKNQIAKQRGLTIAELKAVVCNLKASCGSPREIKIPLEPKRQRQE